MILSETACDVWSAPVLDEKSKDYYQPKEETVKQVYDVNHYQMDDLFVKMLYLKLHEAIMQAEPKAKVEYKKLYIAYKLKTNFVDIVPQKSRLRLTVNLDFDEVYDPKGICKDVTDLGRWGNGNVEIAFDTLDILDSIMEIIMQAIDKQK